MKNLLVVSVGLALLASVLVSGCAVRSKGEPAGSGRGCCSAADPSGPGFARDRFPA